MCVDYTNLNRAYPKDSYPFPNINWLVDGTTVHKILSFLDVYFDYNQISMHPWDKEEIVFVTDDANYYYEVMWFGVKNVGATYQRLMDKIFKGLISRCVKVYVEDIVVKSDSCDQHIKDLKEVFEVLRRAYMRLNLEKSVHSVLRVVSSWVSS